MLDFLDAFCRVLTSRDPRGIARQLKHPLARALPAAVRAEAEAIARGGRIAPTRAFRFYYQTLQLLAPPGCVPFEQASFEASEHPRRSADLAATP